MKPIYLLTVLLSGIVTSLSAQKLAPVIEWQKCLGGTNDDRAYGIKKAIDNGFIVVGSSRSNDGDLSGHHGATTTTDAWVIKISATGEKEWQRNFGGSGDDEFRTIIPTTDGNYLCFGTTTSADGDVTGYHGPAETDWWVVKIDRYGNILWQKALGGSGREIPGNVRQFSDGSLYFIGTTYSADGDVTANASNVSFGEIWIVKMDLAGNLVSQKAYGGSSVEAGYDIAEAADGSYILAIQGDSQDGDFGIMAFEPPRGRVIKFDPVSGVKWDYASQRTRAISITPDGAEQFIVTYNDDYCYPLNVSWGTTTRRVYEWSSGNTGATWLGTLGYCVGMSGSPFGYLSQGPSSYIKFNAVDHINVGTYDTLAEVSTSKKDGFVASHYLSGADSVRIGWKKFIGGTDDDYLVSVVAVSETEFIVAGYTSSNNGDVSGNHGSNDAWVVKLGRTNLIKGTVFIDRNANGTKESNEPLVDNMLVESKKTGQSLASNTHNGLFANPVDTGSYVTQPIVNLPYYIPVPASQNSSFTTYNNSDSISFAIQPVPGKKDYRLQLHSSTAARPGFEVFHSIMYENVGTDTLTNKTIVYVKDSRLSFVSANPAENNISGDTIRWNLASILPDEGGMIGIVLNAAAPPTLEIGDTLFSSAQIDSASDLTPTDNYSGLQQVVVGSFDPNDKFETHAGSIIKDDLDNGKTLLYTIRFQNTGTDTAFNITIRDTLDNRLDWSSLEIVAASHPATLMIKDGNQLTWRFANILLVDSNRNESASHGYVTYRIKPKAGYDIGDTIRNAASIYFDFNLPVATNTVKTIIKTTPVPEPVISGLLADYCSLAGAQTARITNLPANGSGITVTVKIDGATVPVGADSSFSFNVSTLPAGSHTLSVQFSKYHANRVTSSGFTITEAIEPDVSLSANITTITNLATNVIVTAVNAAGGGTDPLYTFARDRNFSNITQAETVNNTWTFNPSILAIGDNRIYVRMKSNAACVVSNTVVDSILLVRSSVTGITDPDLPGQVINIYPNPFKDVITINGLSTSKTYTLKLFDLEGKQLVSKRVSGRSSISLTRQHRAKGIYWLSIYDEKRKQLLGTVKMMKQ